MLMITTAMSVSSPNARDDRGRQNALKLTLTVRPAGRRGRRPNEPQPAAVCGAGYA